MATGQKVQALSCSATPTIIQSAGGLAKIHTFKWPLQGGSQFTHTLRVLAQWMTKCLIYPAVYTITWVV